MVDVLDDIVDECKNTYRTIKVKPIHIKTYFDFDFANSDRNLWKDIKI